MLRKRCQKWKNKKVARETEMDPKLLMYYKKVAEFDAGILRIVDRKNYDKISNFYENILKEKGKIGEDDNELLTNFIKNLIPEKYFEVPV